MRNPGPHDGHPPYHYTYQFGDAGFFVLDIRGLRDWSSGQMLGAEQWDDLIAYLDGPASEAISTLFVVSSVPLAHVARWMTLLFQRFPGRFADSVRDRWSAAAYRAQRDELLARLFGWQTERPGRQVIVLSGDVHVAGAYTLRPRRGPGKITQFTSSAFTTPLTSFERYTNVLAARGSNLFEPRWRFRRHFICYANNAGLVRLTALPSGSHIVEFLVRGWNRRERKLRTVARHSSAPEGVSRSGRIRSGGRSSGR
jgi:phosphodiesterase/alkaline phosphatase D-like protein